MNYRCLSVTLIASGAIPHDYIAQELKNELDWIRVGEGSYYVLTNRKSVDIKNAFRAHLNSTDYVISVPIDPSKINGWVPTTFSQWIYRCNEKLLAANMKIVGASSAAPKLISDKEP